VASPRLSARRPLRLARSSGLLLLIAVATALGVVVAPREHVLKSHALRNAAASNLYVAAKHRPTTPEPSIPARLEKLRRTVAAAHGHLSVAGINLASGQTLELDATRSFFTASTVKVDIATTLFRQLAEARQPISSFQRLLVRLMLENSSDSAASTLWSEVGGAAAVNRTNAALGLKHTFAGAGGFWGLTRTTADDQILLLRQVLVGDALTRTYRGLLLHDMRDVEADQRWGISAAATDRDVLAIKDGWLPHEADDGRWIIDSIGLIGSDRSGTLLAVFSNHHEGESQGIREVDHAAALAGGALD
jgi:Beta-lactamase enzyme family